MRKISAHLTEDNFKKVQDQKSQLQKDNAATVTFADALNNLLEKLQ